MSDLVAFLRARYDEDQDDAERGYLKAQEIPDYQGWDKSTTAALPPAVAVRILAEVTAKRGIIDAHVDRGECTRCEWFSDELYPCDTLKLLGSVYAGHQDYRREWSA